MNDQAKDIGIHEGWTDTIRPSGKLIDLRLHELLRYKDLLLLFVKRDLITQYRQTVLGLLWHVIQPVLTTIIFMILFNSLAKIDTGSLPAVLFYFSSISIWNFFSSCFTATSNTFVANASIFGKVYFPRLILPLSIVISHLIKFLVNLVLLLGMIVWYHFARGFEISIGWHTLLLPAVLVGMGLLGLGAGIIISSLTTKYRDLAVLFQFGIQLLMYLTPVAYPLSFVNNSKFGYFVKLNPLSHYIESFRFAVFGRGDYNMEYLAYSFLITLVIFFTGMILFNKVERSFMDTV